MSDGGDIARREALPRTSCVNPSITYMALTARAADYAVDQLKKRNI